MYTAMVEMAETVVTADVAVMDTIIMAILQVFHLLSHLTPVLVEMAGTAVVAVMLDVLLREIILLTLKM